MQSYFVYILASAMNGTLYIGVTNDLLRRMWEHRNGIFEGFTKRYKVHRLVYFEETSSVEAAIAREKQLKNWRRDWKKNLVCRRRDIGWVTGAVVPVALVPSAEGTKAAAAHRENLGDLLRNLAGWPPLFVQRIEPLPAPGRHSLGAKTRRIVPYD